MRFLISFLLLFFPLFAIAADSPGVVTATTKGAFVELSGPRLDQRKESTLSDSKRTLVVFWRADCAPCATELPGLLKMAETNKDMRMALVSLQGESETRKHFTGTSLPANVRLLVAVGDMRRMLRRFGDTDEALPFSFFLREDVSTCDTHQGLLGSDTVHQWLKKC